ncbi:hypothetical protein VOLCADRAFT_108537, partial [Volvox carteri f. nagariensis]
MIGPKFKAPISNVAQLTRPDPIRFCIAQRTNYASSGTACDHHGSAAAVQLPAAAGGGGGSGLSCCPHCHWGWVCDEHRTAYLTGPHAAVCMSYQHMNESQLLTHRYLTATGRLPNYVPDKPPPRPTGHSSGGVWEPVPAGWAAFRAWRPLPAFDGAMMCLLSKRMSQALTVIQALQHHYTPEQLALRSHIEVHVLGASAFEVPADLIWEEIINLMPGPRETKQQPAAAAAAAAAPAAAAAAESGTETGRIANGEGSAGGG